MTVFGPVRVRRILYSGRGVPGVAPLDTALNLPPEEHSHGVRRHAAEEVTRGSYDDATASIGRNTAATVGKRQVEQLAARAATDFDAFYARRNASNQDVDLADGKHLMVLTMDGKGIVMRHDDLRPATKAAAEKVSNKMRKRLSRGEKGKRKRMATVASRRLGHPPSP